MDTLCRGSHDNIIAIYNHGRLAPPHAFYFIDMELCDINLEEYIYCKRTGVLGLMEWDKAIADGHGVFLICGIMQQILSGLQFIHDHGEVHRDLNPQNST
jgi:serine/threonine protein kinase